MLQSVLAGFALSMDAFAVSVSSGICIRNLKPFHAVRASLSFGLFQFVMPITGWFLGSAFVRYIQGFDHWIAFLLLGFTGGKMIFTALKKGGANPQAEKNAPADRTAPINGEAPGSRKEYRNTADIRSLAALLVLSVATSIDALAVGISLSMLNSNIWASAAIIGLITFFVCLAGFAFGRRTGFLFEKKAETAGGMILIGIGLKILLEHLLSK
jgi:putative Mn2+ efflux pump MntP